MTHKDSRARWGHGEVRLVAGLMLAGCTGNIAPAGAGGPGEATTGPAGDPAQSGTTTLKPVPGCDQTIPGYVMVHRLTRTEYNNTLRDLLGNTSKPGDEFMADVSDGLFDNNSANMVTDADLLGRMETAASIMAQAAVKQPGFVTCNPATTGDVPCARAVLKPFVSRAWRRPALDFEINGLVMDPKGTFQTAKANGVDFNGSLALAVEAVLLSPYFLYRFEFPPSKSTAPFSLDAYSLASRLSYFLWSTMPDNQLTAAAAGGQLSTKEGLTAQIGRMLNDPKASALAQNLAGQWLGGRLAQNAVPNALLYPTFDNSLRDSIAKETELFLEALFHDDSDLRTYLNANFTYVNKRLAQHYKITGLLKPGMADDVFQRVDLTNNQERVGILTHASFLMATAKPDEPSIPKRGRMPYVDFMCSVIGQPPADFLQKQAALEATLANPTRRQVAEKRDQTQGCDFCHANFDPIGIALDGYDAVGASRSYDAADPQKRPIYTQGKWKGQSFNSTRKLANLLEQDSGVPSCLTKTLFRYALGRAVLPTDQCLLDDITKSAIAGDFKAQDVITALASSPAFSFQAQ